MTQYLFHKSEDEFYSIGFSEHADELSQIIITAFQHFNSHDRNVLMNNAFMVNLQIKEVHGNEVHDKIQTFGEMDWRCAWILVDEHFNRVKA